MARPKSMFTRKMISLPADLAERVDEYRFALKFRTESEAVRRLIELGLQVAGQDQPRQPSPEPAHP